MTQTKPNPGQDDRAIDIQDKKKDDGTQTPEATGFDLPDKDAEPASRESRNDQ